MKALGSPYKSWHDSRAGMSEPKPPDRLDLGQLANLDIRVDAAVTPSVIRALWGRTTFDAAIEGLPVPEGPFPTMVGVRAIRWYRARLSPHLGNRCVFDPSCSRYAELALRRYGIGRGISTVLGRLLRCKPGNGGIDMPPELGEMI